MKVGYVLPTYPRASDTFVQREVAGVRAAGVEVETFSVRRPPTGELVGPEQRAEHASTTYLLPASAAAIVRAQAHFARRHPARWRTAWRLAAETRSPGVRATGLQAAYLAEATMLADRVIQAEIEHLHNHFGDQSGTVTMLAALLADVPFSMTVHGPHVFFEPHRFALGAKASRAAFVACISDFCRSQLMVFTEPEVWSRLHVVHCGVEPTRFEAPKPGRAGALRVIAVGRLAAEKGLRILLEAAKLADRPGLSLTLVGDGPERGALEERARAWNLSVTMTGNLSQAEVRSLLRESDVLVSTGLAEGLPTVLMEGMAAGVPVIGTRVAGVSELVDQSCGRLVPAGNAAALAAALVEIYDLSGEQRRVMGEAGRQIAAAGFDAGREAAKLAALFTG